MAATSLDVEHLFTLTAQVEIGAHQRIVGGPHGDRLVAEVPGGTFEGPRLRGRIVPPGGDWVANRPNGVIKLDVRLLLVTDDGASILMSYNGIGRRGPDYTDIRTAPTFETGDERYLWLNEVQAIGVGRSVPGSVTYDIYALR